MKSYNGFTPAQREKGGEILKEAIRNGVLPDPKTCSCFLCGQDKGIRHYHNEDYSEENIINDAKVVCWRCHMMIHTRYRHPLSFGKYMIDVTLYKKQFPPVFVGDDWKALEMHYID